ncbi:Amyloid beta A4 precursor protein-binding family B member 1, partial [Eschrichtius robustus]|nr:Amyloid beta A4 precursor protein-binding family B member 1 [Eschrichtius robustus]
MSFLIAEVEPCRADQQDGVGLGADWTQRFMMIGAERGELTVVGLCIAVWQEEGGRQCPVSRTHEPVPHQLCPWHSKPQLGSAKAMSVPSSLSQSAINANSHGGPALSLPLPLHAAHNQLLNAKLQATAVGPKDLRSAMGEGSGPEPGPANAKWLKEGQNQLRRAATAHRDQNRNVTLTLAEEASQEPEMAPLGPKGLMHLYSELELSTHNAANRGLRGPGLIISTREQGPDEGEEKAAGEAEEDDEEEEEEEEEDLSSPPGLPEPLESAEMPPGPQALADGPREHSKSASLLFGMRNSAASDEDSSWATLSQGSPSYGSPEDT